MEVLGIFNLILLCFGFAVLFYWLLTTGFGRRSLSGCAGRPNRLSIYLPLGLLFSWLMASFLVNDFISSSFSYLPQWQQTFLSYGFLAFVELFIIILVLFGIGRWFSDGLRGFGLRFGFRGIFRDFCYGFFMFISSWPLVAVGLFLTVALGKVVSRGEFQLEQNEALATILDNQQLPLRVLAVFFAVIITPVFEEFMFRGLLQSYLCSIGISVWRRIFIVSIIFTLLHPLTHFPALLLLAVYLGYSYERTGSLFSSIFIHILFNSTSIFLALSSK